MTEQELEILAQKVESGIATSQEEDVFRKEYERFLKRLNDSLDIEIITNQLKQ